MFFLHLWLDLSFCVFIQGLTLVKKKNSLSINHQFAWISITINNSNCIPIGISVVGHESF
jgi:hypothetical protein